MTTRTLASIGFAGALASVALLGGTAVDTSRAVAGRVGSGAESRAADKAADQATRALKRHKSDEAIRYAETAVQLMPGDAGFRALLGRAYLAAGRFESARTALIDSLSINDLDGSAALNLSLAQIATGDWAGARATLEAHQETVPVRDRGLALALAGDPATAVELLQTAVRAPDADATTRQNLALALALAGRWAEAKVVAAIDVPAGELNDRMMQWLAFAQPRSAADQVAAILGVTPVLDDGQPTGLALRTKQERDIAAGESLDAFMPGTPGKQETAEAQAGVEADEVVVAAATVAPAQPVEQAGPPAELIAAALETPAAAMAVRVTFAPRREIVQPIPRSPLRTAPSALASKGAIPAMLARGTNRAARIAPAHGKPGSGAAKMMRTDGKWYVQLGAFDTMTVARERWNTLSRRVGVLGAHQPHGAQAMVNGASYYRLSVGGFAQREALGMCAEIRRVGARCFVRQEAGDRVAAWLRPADRRVQLASR